ncbi:MAG: hypothetical protein GXP37_01400 [Chloroflexi bacterium]|nr:hypothetical protein [Chloroflexota bacterium]
MLQPFEKLGAFYLGKEYDIEKGELTADLVMYDARDLTTHAVCVGMTGSGKTGLCIDLLEEAAIDNVPALLIDPKGDITNLLLTFPDLAPEDFEPWVNVDDARRKGMSVPEYARKIADTWRKGLAGWGEGPERIRMLKNSAEFRVYTPGSDAGLPISILSSFRAPQLNWDDHAEILREQIQGVVSALLGLMDIDADPLRSREHILLSTIFEHYWKQGEDLDIAKIITAIQTPPVRQLGVFDIDTFFPAKDRFGLAMAMNNIIASPSFASWLEGEGLDISNLLYAPDGKPRHSIFYIAHLNDAERMFFVTLLLEQLITWMRQQSGTTSLRALLYMDEVFGFFPPVANPPSKKPLLTLMKQARAYGVGVVLTTQNPVDIDYKGLSNAGTWFIGKLQTERDKARVLDGLESATSQAGSTLDRRTLDKAISALDSRVFILHNVHEDQPVIFNTRWAMSYLRGPLTRSQVRTLMAKAKRQAQPAAAAPARNAAPRVQQASPAATATPSGTSSTPPALPPGFPQVYLPVRISANRALAILEKELKHNVQADETRLVYDPALLAQGRVSFVDRRRGVNETQSLGMLVYPNDISTIIRWQDADLLNIETRELEPQPETDALFNTIPAELNSLRELKSYAKDFSDFLYHEKRLGLFYNPSLKMYSQSGESERDFKVRLQQAARERRDAEVDKMRRKYRIRLDRLETRLKREERELTDDEAEYEARKREEMISGAETVIGMLGIFGRRRSRGLTTAATKRRMTTRAKADIAESHDEIARLQAQIADLQQTIQDEAEEITGKWAEALDASEPYLVKPRRADVRVDIVALGWLPYWEITYPAASGRSVQDRIPSWQD